MSRSFSLHLLKKGLLDKDQLVQSLKQQKQVIATPERVAVDLGYLTTEQRDEISAKASGSGKSFLDAALELGRLTREHYSEIVVAQTSNQRYLCEAIASLDILPLDTVNEEFDAFEAVLHASDAGPPGGDGVKRGSAGDEEDDIPCRNILDSLCDVFARQLREIAGMDAELGSIAVTRNAIDNLGSLVMIDANSGTSLILFLTLEERTTKHIVSIMMKFLEQLGVMDIGSVRLVYDDCIGEFFNIICGHVRGDLAKTGQDIRFKTPKVERIEGKSRLILSSGNLAAYRPAQTPHGLVQIGFIKGTGE